MHATMQSGGRSPKSLNGSASSQQLKSGSDIPNSSTSFPSHVKGKKRERERGDQLIQQNEPIKRERSAKTEDEDCVNFRLDRMIKTEIAKITDKGGLMKPEGVDKLVHLMQLVRADKKTDLAGRIFLANVIAATDRNDCLSRFVQLKGVPVLDGWVQEAHKWKTGEGTSPQENDKDVEELLLALLRALDKLPVSLNALQTCHIGKSVNHLRSHKNSEIQKKSRSLVETWKKRVDAEIKKNDAKTFGSSQAVQWPSKQGFSEGPHAFTRRATCTDVTSKSSITQPLTPGMSGHADAIVKSTPLTAGALKLPSLPASVTTSSKDPLLRAAGNGVNVELPQMVVKEEKSSSSSQSQNNSQSCSSGHARSSSAGSVSASKTSGGSSRHRRRSGNGFPANSTSGVQKESNLGKSGSPVRPTTSDKAPQGVSICERPLDKPVPDKVNSHKLIVRLPKSGRSPLLNTSGGSCEDPSVIGSRGSSPSVHDKHEHNDPKALMRDDRPHNATDANIELSRGNKEELSGSDECARSPGTTANDKSQSAAETDKARAISSSPGNGKEDFSAEPKPKDSFGSMNALIESCVKSSEASVSVSAGDDIGMNLLASVATGEMSKSDIHLLKGSPGSLPAIEETSAGNTEAKSRSACEAAVTGSQDQSDENRDVYFEKHGKSARGELHVATTDISGDKKTIVPLQESKSTAEHIGHHPISSLNSHEVEDSRIKSEGKLEDSGDRNSSLCIPADAKEEHDRASHHQDKLKIGDPVTCKLKATNLSVDEIKSPDRSSEKISVLEKRQDSGMNTSKVICEYAANVCTTVSCKKAVDADCLMINNEMPCGATSTEHKPSSIEESHTEDAKRRGNITGGSSCADEVSCPDGEQIDSEQKHLSTVEPSGSGTMPLVTINVEVNNTSVRKEAREIHPRSTIEESSPTFHPQEAERCTETTAADGRDEVASSTEALLVVDSVSKLDFDLNEGIAGDDGSPNEPDTSAVLMFASSVHPPCILSSSPTSNGSHAPVTVAAPAKGPFIPPENMSKKPEPGWKGTAATSAFRPAEPRKVLEMPLAVPDVSSSEVAGRKYGRPLLDIDLNVAELIVLDDIPSPSSVQTTGSESGVIGNGNRDATVRPSGGLDLDLNKIDEDVENGQFLARPSGALNKIDEDVENGQFLARPSSGALNKIDEDVENGQLLARPSGALPSGDGNLLRDFDLNNGPGFDEAPRSQHAKSITTVPFIPPVAGLQMNNPEFGSVSTWFPSGNAYPAVAIPSFLPDRGEQPYPIVAAAQRIPGPINGGDMYRGPVLSSSPAMAFSPATAFPYAGFPFGSSFSVASTSYSGAPATYVDSLSAGGSSFHTNPSQVVGPVGAISSQYPRPYMFSLPEGSTSGTSDSSRKWARHGLDLNAGPGNIDAEVRDDRFPSAPRQLSISGSQAFVEEQTRLYQLAGAGSKRKDPEGGWDAERFVSYKQHPWQ